MSTRTSLIDAFLAGDADAAVALLAGDARFHSPVRSYRGAEKIEPLWRLIGGIIEDVRLAGLLEGDGETAGFFQGTVGGKAIDGVLRVRAPEAGQVTDVTLMLRPYGPLKAAIGEMARRLEAA